MQLPRPLAAALNRMPLPPVQSAVRLVFRQVLAQHPGLFDRLGPYAARRFRFDPTDLDLSFVIHPAGPDIAVYRAGKAPPAAATICGPFITLLALLEGQIDGDAVFFSRSLSVSGDMEAVLALRNGLDDCGLDLPRDLSMLAGPLAPPFRRFAEHIRSRALAGLV